MAGDATPSEPGNEKPRKMILDLSALIAPPVSVETTIGKVFLYPLRVSDITQFGKLTSNSPSTQLREFLPAIASLIETSQFKDERQPLAEGLVAKLSDDEIEVIAEAYAASSSLEEARSGSKDRSALPKDREELATSYLDRLLRKEIEEQAESMKRMREQMLASTTSIFDQVRKSSAALGATVSSFEGLSRSAATQPIIETRQLEFSNHMAEQHAKLARERTEELEMVRLTGQMTAQSATTLRDLAEAATTLLERLDARDQKSDGDTRRSLRIAVWSVAISAVLALVALVVSGASYVQDKANNTSGDTWQASVLSALSQGNLERQTLSAENKKLQAKVDELAKLVQSSQPKVEAKPAR